MELILISGFGIATVLLFELADRVLATWVHRQPGSDRPMRDTDRTRNAIRVRLGAVATTITRPVM
jgi:hypothetical protein